MKANFLHILDGLYKKLENGSIFKSSFLFLYSLLAISHIVLFLSLVYIIFDKQFFSLGGQIPIFLIVIMILSLLFSYFGFTLWYNRHQSLSDHIEIENEFIVTPILAKFINTIAENIAGGVLIFGLGISLTSLFVGFNFNTLLLLEIIGLGSFLNFGLWGLIIYPLSAFLILIVGRLLSEAMSVLVTIANNIKPAKTLSDTNLLKEASQDIINDGFEAEVYPSKEEEKSCNESSEGVLEQEVPTKEPKAKNPKTKKTVKTTNSTLSSEFAE